MTHWSTAFVSAFGREGAGGRGRAAGFLFGGRGGGAPAGAADNVD